MNQVPTTRNYSHFTWQCLKLFKTNCELDTAICEFKIKTTRKNLRVAEKVSLEPCSKSYILTPPHPKGHVMSVKCEELIDELKFKFGYYVITQTLNFCTLFVSGTKLRTDGRTNRQTVRLLDAPGRPFRQWALGLV